MIGSDSDKDKQNTKEIPDFVVCNQTLNDDIESLCR